VHTLWHELKTYNETAAIGEIARRYFAMNAFDGVLTVTGILMGNWLAGVTNTEIVISTGVATSVAMGVSGLWGAYLTESAERKREIAELSRATLTDLKHTRVGRASRAAVIIVAIVDGISPALAALIALLPFFVVDLLPSIAVAYALSLGIALTLLFVLGMFLGHISQENRLVFGVKTILAGFVSIAISWLLGSAG
jgi:predicted membrane protein (TIGR00267 family)